MYLSRARSSDQPSKKLAKALETKGYSVACPKLPSISNQDDADFGKKSLTDDTKAVEDVIKDLVEQQEKVFVVLMRSYGGLVGSNAVPKELSWADRQANGKKGGVIYLFYFAAFILGQGQSVIGTFGESPNTGIKGERYCMKDPATSMYSDLPAEESKLWAEQVVDQSYAVQTTELSHAAYKYISSTYVISEHDQALPPQFQEMFAGATGSEIQRVATGYSPMLSKTDELVELIDAATLKALDTIKGLL